MMNRPSDDASVGERRIQSRLRETSLNVPRPRLPRLPRWLGAPGDVADPSKTMFQRIRRSMTLLYTAVLVVTLLFAGTVLYLAVLQTVNQEILDPARESLTNSVRYLSGEWVNSYTQAGVSPCQIGGPGGPDRSQIIYACFDAQGNLIGATGLASNIGSFTSADLAQRALHAPSGCAHDVLSSSGPFGDIMRKACVVHGSGQTLGVILVGEPILQTLEQLHALLILLLIVGAITVVVSALGGFLLSARALVPARLAYSRQQQFIGDVSHELRTPLTLLRADAEMLLRGRNKLTADDAELLDDIVDETARLAALTSSLLTLARLDSDTHAPERETIDLAEVAANVARRTAAFASERQVTVRAEGPAGLLVSGVRDLIDQTALILVDNAIKYNQPGGHVEARAERRGERIALIVSDDGPGVALENLERLGERFYRPDKARARQTGQDGGAGLGISIARGVAALHQGSLIFSGAPGHGLMATLELPAARARREPQPDDAPDASMGSATHEAQDAARL